MSFDWTLPTRTERYVFEQLDVRLNRVGALAGVVSCGLDWSIYDTYRASGDLDVRTMRPMLWSEVVVRPWAVVANRSGMRAVPLATMLCRPPNVTLSPKGVDAQVSLFDMSLVLDESLLYHTHTVEAGANIIDAVRWVFDYGHLSHRVSITDSPRTLAATRTWVGSDDEPISWLRVINDLLDLAGYYALWTDPMGVWQVQPYRLPSERATAYRLADDGESYRYLDEFEVSSSADITYNEWTYWSKGDDDTEPVLYYGANDDPTHPYSRPRLLRSITRRKTGVEGDVAAVVQRDRAEDMADQRTFTVDARYLPVQEHEVVELVNRQHEIALRGTVTKRSLKLERNAPVTLTLREVS